MTPSRLDRGFYPHPARHNWSTVEHSAKTQRDPPHTWLAWPARRVAPASSAGPAAVIWDVPLRGTARNAERPGAPVVFAAAQRAWREDTPRARGRSLVVATTDDAFAANGRAMTV